MTLKKTILISAATYLVLNFILWLLGSLIWPIILIGLWFGAGHLSFFLEEKYSNWECPRFPAYLFGPIWMVFICIDYRKQILKENWLPKIRNPFVWPQKELDKEDKI